MVKFLGPIVILLLTAILLFFQSVLRDIRFIPIVLVAMILSPMVLEWLIGKRDFFNPSGLVAVLLFQFMVVSPTLAYIHDNYRLHMDDTRTLLSNTMWMCLFGIVFFVIGHSIPIGERIGIKRSQVIRFVDVPKAQLLAILFIIMGFAASFAYFAIAIGRGGTWGTRYSATQGLGYISTIAEFLKIGLLLLIVISIQKYFDRVETNVKAGKFGLFLNIFLVTSFLIFLIFFRGSRGLILMYLFWVLGMVHFTLKKVKLKYLIIPIIFAIPALHIYGLYKSFGFTAFADYFHPARRASMQEASRQSLVGLLIGDLGRVNVWMFANQEISNGNFDHTWGKTYAGGSVAFIPQAIWHNRPHGMSETITDMVQGKGAYQSTQEKTSRVTGLIGEAYINFGWPFIMVVMFIYGVLVRSVSTLIENTPNTAAKAFLAPLLILMLMYLFIWDWVWIVFKTFSLVLPVYITYRLVMPKLSDVEATYGHVQIEDIS